MTVAAISTPAAVGGIAMIRISGESALKIADEIFVSPSGKKPSQMAGYTCAYGEIAPGGNRLDDGILTVFRSPKSYTGEDVVEISCHGGIYVSRKILREILRLGAEPAGPGEFTKRAFLNGKLSLTQAEAVMDIVSAEGDAALSSANLMREGAIYKKAREISKKLVEVLSSLAAWTDYPDEDLPEAEPEKITGKLAECREALKKLISGYDEGLIFKEGVPCAIVGRPNVGKSTLMNALLGYERSIVTDEAGTTRDVIEERLRLGDLILKLSDTAGLREAKSEAERQGVRLSEKSAERASLVLAVFDGSRELSPEDMEVLKICENKRRIIVINKVDLPQKIDKEYFKDEIILEVEAKTGRGVEKIKAAAYEALGLEQGGAPEVYANERQKLCCERALKFVSEAEEAALRSETLDAVTVLADEAAGALLELSGERVTEAVVEDVFSRFCVGK